MNGGIQPTVELATNNGNGFGYPYPVYPMMMGGNGGNGGFGFGGSEAIWLIVLLALIWGNNNGNGGGFFGGGNSFDDGYAWLSNGQKEIMSNTNNGFDTLHLSNSIQSVHDGIYSLSNQLCNCCSDMQQTVSNGFANAEVSNNARQIANMQQAFATQTALTGAISGVSSQLADCCCENRLATIQTQNIVQNEANATRYADAINTRDLLTNQTASTQAILDKLCQLELDGVKAQVDAKNDRISELERQLQMADLRASQTAQNAFIAQGLTDEVDALYNRLSNCPVPTTPVYGRTPIFTCPNNNGCGCNGNNNLLF